MNGLCCLTLYMIPGSCKRFVPPAVKHPPSGPASRVSSRRYGATPVSGNQFQLVTAGTISGDFATKNLPANFGANVSGANYLATFNVLTCGGTILPRPSPSWP